MYACSLVYEDVRKRCIASLMGDKLYAWYPTQLFTNVEGTLHSVEKTLIQKAYCVYYYILKEQRFFMSINSVVDFSLNFK